jgi:hypothetical protein
MNITARMHSVSEKDAAFFFKQISDHNLCLEPTPMDHEDQLVLKNQPNKTYASTFDQMSHIDNTRYQKRGALLLTRHPRNNARCTVYIDANKDMFYWTHNFPREWAHYRSLFGGVLYNNTFYVDIPFMFKGQQGQLGDTFLAEFSQNQPKETPAQMPQIKLLPDLVPITQHPFAYIRLENNCETNIMHKYKKLDYVATVYLDNQVFFF